MQKYGVYYMLGIWFRADRSSTDRRKKKDTRKLWPIDSTGLGAAQVKKTQINHVRVWYIFIVYFVTTLPGLFHYPWRITVQCKQKWEWEQMILLVWMKRGEMHVFGYLMCVGVLTVYNSQCPSVCWLSVCLFWSKRIFPKLLN